MHERDARMDNISNTYFARWLLDQSILAGYGNDAETQVAIVVYASIALNEGLTREQTESLANALAVTPQEVTAAYISEMRQRVTEELMAHPDLVDLNAHLDAIARTP
ncbi:hypothetical protein [Streptomyces sp. NPDC059009]|uniref:hypothetical protein n=1 Tax=Streptomyces sp. NPDC059009 TaxID=3346694 RepID=UPI0036D1F751